MLRLSTKTRRPPIPREPCVAKKVSLAELIAERRSPNNLTYNQAAHEIAEAITPSINTIMNQRRFYGHHFREEVRSLVLYSFLRSGVDNRKYESERPLLAYLSALVHSAARSVCMEEARRKETLLPYADVESNPYDRYPAPGFKDVLEQLAAEETHRLAKEHLVKTLSQLPLQSLVDEAFAQVKPNNQCAWAVFIELKNYKPAAARLGIKPEVFKMRLARARFMFLDHFTPRLALAIRSQGIPKPQADNLYQAILSGLMEHNQFSIPGYLECRIPIKQDDRPPITPLDILL